MACSGPLLLCADWESSTRKWWQAACDAQGVSCWMFISSLSSDCPQVSAVGSTFPAGNQKLISHSSSETKQQYQNVWVSSPRPTCHRPKHSQLDHRRCTQRNGKQGGSSSPKPLRIYTGCDQQGAGAAMLW